MMPQLHFLRSFARVGSGQHETGGWHMDMQHIYTYSVLCILFPSEFTSLGGPLLYIIYVCSLCSPSVSRKRSSHSTDLRA